MFTINGAYALGADRETGSLKIPSSRISDTKVLRTILGGRTVCSAGR